MPPNSAATSLVPSADMAMAFHSCEPGCLERVSMSKLAIAMATTVALTSSASAWSDMAAHAGGWTHRQKARCSEHKTKLLPP